MLLASPEDRIETAVAAAAIAPAVGGFAEIGKGIVWIRLPIPGALRHINVWLVPSRSGWFLVDTGMKTDDVEAAWLGLERRLPLRQELERIVVTHDHPDHFGMARWLSERHGVPVFMTARSGAAATAALDDASEEAPRPSDGYVERLGVELDGAMAAILRGNVYRAIVSGLPPLSVLDEGVAIEGADRTWQVSVHHGHAPGHACLLDAVDDVLISGDQVLPTISSNVSLYPSNETGDPLGDYLASLDALAMLPPSTLILPAHGLPFATLHARIQALRDEHALRLGQVVAACATPRSTADVVGGMFPMERLDPLNRLLATTEALAHLRHLELRGRIRREGSGRRLRWTTN